MGPSKKALLTYLQHRISLLFCLHISRFQESSDKLHPTFSLFLTAPLKRFICGVSCAEMLPTGIQQRVREEGLFIFSSTR